MTVNPALFVEWACGWCRARGRMARLDDATLGDMRDAIRRGHERKSPACHRARGARRVVFTCDGLTHRFGTEPSTQPPTCAPEARPQ